MTPLLGKTELAPLLLLQSLPPRLADAAAQQRLEPQWQQAGKQQVLELLTGGRVAARSSATEQQKQQWPSEALAGARVAAGAPLHQQAHVQRRHRRRKRGQPQMMTLRLQRGLLEPQA